MTITTASLKDINDLVELFDAYRVFYHKESDKATAKSFLSARIEQEESVIYLARDKQNNPAGFVQLYPLFSSTRMKKLWLLNDLYVRPENRSQGIGIALIDKAKELCRTTNACSLILETTKDNDIGNQLYPKTGFTVDEDHNYYAWDL